MSTDTFNLKDPALFINRELSLLEFNRRVLEEAEDERNPLLERAKFLAIYSANMDEFFMIRVAGLKQQVAAGVTDTPADGLTPRQQVRRIQDKVREFAAAMYACYRDIHQKLVSERVFINQYDELTADQQAALNDHFNQAVFPVLTPLAFDPGRPFPHISSLSLNLAVIVRDPHTEQEQFARIKVPDLLSRLVPVPRAETDAPDTVRYIWVEDLIAHNLPALFPGYEIAQVHGFRITRNADMELEADEAGDLMQAIESVVRQRHFGFVTRFTVVADMPDDMRQMLAARMDVPEGALFESDGPLGLSGLMKIMKTDRPELKDAPYHPVRP